MAPARKVMITGASGHIGTFMRRTWADRWTVLDFDRTSGFDVTDAGSVAAFVRTHRPSVAVHLASFGNIQSCERNPLDARRVIVEGTRNLAAACSGGGCHLIVISSDYVFDGARGGYGEADLPQPRSVFGQSKLMAEAITRASCGTNSLVLRTAGVYGYIGGKPDNFDAWALNRLTRGQAVVAFADVYNTPTFVGDLVVGVEKCIQHGVTGLYHLAGAQRASRYEFCRLLARSTGLCEQLVVAGRALDVEGELRPRDVSLVSRALSKALDMEFCGVEDGLRRASYREASTDTERV